MSTTNASKAATPPSALDEPTTPSALANGATPEWPALPTETEIYILPSGEVVVADLPAELAGLVEQLGDVKTDDLPESFPASGKG